ncbi:polysaccharide export outer membrane protein [Epilithonimonas hungarica]|uniref:polysaccharide biosynthesis/export family protein n=1 Tax=Epilithonimonas hungarica TaxID=454006 RepID=UPI0027872920|nr:polysaccharide biosynthesis/export family protein [Epilithonimonas hungarica]MDP9956836.1 polysaccharide export outer membrane protein [Epilithonimonas hungarica]
MKRQILIILIFIFTFSCKPKENMIYMSNHNFEQETNQARYVGLKIKEADVLDIKVSAFDEIAVKPFNIPSMVATNDSNNNGESSVASLYTVSNEGYIVIPVVGRVFCKGLTKKQLEEDLEERLKVYLTDPRVDIKLTNFSFSVLGAVGNPGQKTTNNEKVNLFQAISLAGDMSSSANTTNVKLLRFSEEKQQDTIVSLDFSDASIVKSPYYYLQQNDILYVEPDRNAQIAANTTNPNRALLLSLLTVTISVIALIIRFR